MIKKEAIALMEQGKHISHTNFLEGEHMTLDGDDIVFENGIRQSLKSFFEERNSEIMKDGYYIYGEHTKSMYMLPSYDKRKTGYGIHGADLVMSYKSIDCEIKFVVYTNWMTNSITNDGISQKEPIPANVSYISKNRVSDDCLEVNGKFIGSYYTDKPVELYYLLVHEGSGAVFKKMHHFHNTIVQLAMNYK